MLDNAPIGHFETRYSKRGFPVQVWVRDMPRFDDSIIDCVVYLYPSEAAAEDGEKIGGSGFLVGAGLADENRTIVSHLPCVVTNRHVVRDGNMVVRINTRDGGTDIVALDGEEWIYHPDGDDIAVCPIGLHFMHKCKCIPDLGGLNNRKIIDQLDIGIGDDVVVPGRFINREGKNQNTPALRFGNISQMPKEPMIMSDGFAQEAFLVEVRTLSGYSGSPVFLYILPQPSLENVPEDQRKHIYRQFPGVREKRRNMNIGFPPILLGMAFCYIYSNEQVHNKRTGQLVPDHFVRTNTGMMGVVPVWKLVDIFLGGPMNKIKEEAEAELRKRQDESGVGLATAHSDSDQQSDHDQTDNPQHKEDFNRLLGEAVQKPQPDGQT